MFGFTICLKQIYLVTTQFDVAQKYLGTLPPNVILWRSQPKNLRRGKKFWGGFTLSDQQYFVWDTASQSIK